MALLKRQATLEIFDDQSPTLWNSYVGIWTRYSSEGANNGTLTATKTSGASLSFSFSGSQAWLYGSLSSGNPNAEYTVDGIPVRAGSPQPLYYPNGPAIYFQTPGLSDGPHKIDITVTMANETNQFIVDYFLVTPIAGGSISGVETSRNIPSSTIMPPSTSMPSSTSTSSILPIVAARATPVGAIAGGIVGGVAGIAILVIVLWYFLRKRTDGGQAYYFEKPTPTDILANEDYVIEPFNATAAPAHSSAGFDGPGPHSAYFDGSSNQPLNPALRQGFASSIPSQSQYTQSGPNEVGLTYVSGDTAQPRTGKVASMAQQYQNVQQPVQHEDSGTRFNENEEEEAGPSQLPTEVPPSYTPR